MPPWIKADVHTAGVNMIVINSTRRGGASVYSAVRAAYRVRLLYARRLANTCRRIDR